MPWWWPSPWEVLAASIAAVPISLYLSYMQWLTDDSNFEPTFKGFWD